MNDLEKLAEEVQKFVAEDESLAWSRADLEGIIAPFGHRERDTGRLHSGSGVENAWRRQRVW